MTGDFKNNKTIISVVGMAILMAIVVIILFSGSSVISQEKIERRLQQFADSVARAAAANGKEGKLTHGALVMEGWGFDKHAVIHNVNLSITDKAAVNGQSWTLSTDKMFVNPDRAIASQLFFVFPDPLVIAANNQPQANIAFPSPLKYAYFDGKEHNAHTIIHSIFLPEQIVVTPVKQPGDTDNSGKIVFTYGANPILHIKELPDTHEREAVYSFNHIKVSGDDGTVLSVASLASNFDEKQIPPGNAVQGHYKLTLADMVLVTPSKTGKPYSFDGDISYSGDQTAATTAGVMPNFGNGQMQLHKLILAGDTFKLSGEGTINTAPDDPLPFGAVTLTIDNISAFLASDLVPEGLRPTVASALQKITGKPVSGQDQAVIPLKRDKSGLLYIGNTTLEELSASLLSDMLKPGSATPTQPATPATNAPVSTAPAAQPGTTTATPQTPSAMGNGATGNAAPVAPAQQPATTPAPAPAE